MPLPGGSSDKYGNRYEDRWLAQRAFDVLRDESVSLRSEPPGSDEAGFEFWVDYPDRREYHQVKRQLTGEGRWSIGALRSAGVLQAFYDKLQRSDAHCVFVSGHAAYTIEELADRARKSESFEEYEHGFLASETWRSHFDELRRSWGNDDSEWTWRALARVRTVVISEAELASSNGLAAELLFDGHHEQGVATLISVLRDHVNQRLTARAIWEALSGRGIRPSTWSKNEQAALLLSAANELYRESRRGTLIGGALVERPEAVEIADLLRTDPIVLVDGPAGIGKSDVLLGLSDILIERSIPHLSLRLDRLKPTARPDQLGQELGLPASPPAVLAAVAQGEQSVLVVDQLDMVSTSSGRNPQFFQCVDALLRQAATEPQMRVVLACRSFDLANDARLRALAHGRDDRPVVTVGPFDHSRVKAVAGGLGYKPDALDIAQLDLLAVPLNLALLTEIASSSDERSLSFATRRDLYDAFWKHKRRDVDARLGRASAWVDVIDRLVDYMSEEQVLSAPCELLDEWETDAEAMASSHILVRDGRSYAFFHETFFDYLFARRFIARGRSLRELLSGDQLLFRRAQVRQVLTHERSISFPPYIKDLDYLLNAPSIRFHIKDLVLAWLGGIDAPAAEEWQMVCPLLGAEDDAIKDRAWRLMTSPGWFEYADNQGAVEGWVAEDGDVGVRGRWVLGQVLEEYPGRAVELLGALMDGSDEARAGSTAIVSRADLATDRGVFELFLRLLDDPLAADGIANTDFWYVAHELPETHPEWGCELLGRYLVNRVAAARATGVTNALEAGNGLIRHQMHLVDFVTKCAADAPARFVEHVWPPVLDVIDQTAEEFREDELWRDRVWPLRHYGDHYTDLDEVLLLGLEKAFAGLAGEDPARFTELVSEQACTHCESVVHLCFEGFAGNPSCLADQAVDFILTDPRRFRVAYSSCDYWGARRLVAAITPHCSEESLGRLSQAIVAFYPSWERSAAGHRQHGLAQFCLLGGIDDERRTPALRKRYAELQRKFGEDTAEPMGVQGGMVHSPISDRASEKLTDEQWGKAIARYRDDRGLDAGDFLKGGAHQLSSVLEQRTIADPTRFARLALTLSDETNSYYFDAILRGVAASDHDVPLDLTRDLCLRCRSLPSHASARWIGGAIVKHRDEELPDELIDVLSWCAVECSDPESDRDPESDGDRDSLLQHGLNSVRGGAAGTIAALVYAREENYARLRSSIEALVSDQVMAVRAMAAETVLALLRFHSEDALTLLEVLVDGAPDRLLTSRYVQAFFRHRGATDFERLRPVLERMIKADLSEARAAGAAWVTLAALGEEGAHRLAAACLTGCEQMRLGAARVYAANLNGARYQQRCEEALLTLFNDDEVEVRKAAASALTRLDGDALGDFEQLAERFLDSHAAEDDPEQILFTLRSTTASVPKLALTALGSWERSDPRLATSARWRRASLASFRRCLSVPTPIATTTQG